MTPYYSNTLALCTLICSYKFYNRDFFLRILLDDVIFFWDAFSKWTDFFSLFLMFHWKIMITIVKILTTQFNTLINMIDKLITLDSQKCKYSVTPLSMAIHFVFVSIFLPHYSVWDKVFLSIMMWWNRQKNTFTAVFLIRPIYKP